MLKCLQLYFGYFIGATDRIRYIYVYTYKQLLTVYSPVHAYHLVLMKDKKGGGSPLWFWWALKWRLRFQKGYEAKDEAYGQEHAPGGRGRSLPTAQPSPLSYKSPAARLGQHALAHGNCKRTGENKKKKHSKTWEIMRSCDYEETLDDWAIHIMKHLLHFM